MSVMTMTDVNPPCAEHEEQIQNNRRNITELQSEIKFKEKRIDDIYTKIEKMDEKIDDLNKNMNKLIQASMKSDADIEKRIVAMETKIRENERAVQDNRNRFTLIISVITIFFTALTFIFNFILH